MFLCRPSPLADSSHNGLDTRLAKPPPSLLGIVAAAGLELLEKTYHSGRPKRAAQRFEARPPNLIRCHASYVHFPIPFLNHVSGFSTFTAISSEQRDATDSS